MTELDGRVVEIKHGEIIKSAHAHRVRSASKVRYVQDTDSSEEDVFMANENMNENILAKIISLEARGVKNNRHRRTDAEILAQECGAIVEGLPEKGGLHLK